MLDKAMPLADVVTRLADCASRKQPWAIKLWLAYRWGEPIQRQEVTGKDGAPVRYAHTVDYDAFAAEFNAALGSGDAGGDGAPDSLDSARTDAEASSVSGAPVS